MMLPDNCVGIIEYCFIKYDENTKLDPGDYIVILKYKYDWEKHYTYETNRMSICDGLYKNYGNVDFFLNDSWEGQDDFQIIAYCPLDIDINYMKEIDHVSSNNQNDPV